MWWVRTAAPWWALEYPVLDPQALDLKSGDEGPQRIQSSFLGESVCSRTRGWGRLIKILLMVISMEIRHKPARTEPLASGCRK